MQASLNLICFNPILQRGQSCHFPSFPSSDIFRQIWNCPYNGCNNHSLVKTDMISHHSPGTPSRLPPVSRLPILADVVPDCSGTSWLTPGVPHWGQLKRERFGACHNTGPQAAGGLARCVHRWSLKLSSFGRSGYFIWKSRIHHLKLVFNNCYSTTVVCVS